MNSISTIQTLAKIGQILSKIFYIVYLIAAIACGVGLISLPFADTGIFKIGGVTIYGLIVNHAGIELNSLYPSLAAFLIVCVGQAVTARTAERYFEHEMAAGTPFTPAGARELMRLGIVTIAVPLGTRILSQIVSRVIATIIGSGEAFRWSGGDNVVLGVMFLVTALLCRYGAEREERTNDDT